MERRSQFRAVVRLGDADAGAQVGRLDEHGVREPRLHPVHHRFGIPAPLGPRDPDVLHDRQAVGLQDGLHDQFVHAHC